METETGIVELMTQTAPRKHQFRSAATVVHNGRRAINAAMAAQILNDRSEVEFGERRQYDANRVYQLARAGKIDARKFGNTLLYFKDSVEKVELSHEKYVHERKPYRRQVGPEGYSPARRGEVLALWASGEYPSIRQLAEVVDIPGTTIGRWIKRHHAESVPRV